MKSNSFLVFQHVVRPLRTAYTRMMSKHSYHCSLLAGAISLLPLVLIASSARAEDPTINSKSPQIDSKGKSDGRRYIRVTRDWRGNPQALETSIVRLIPEGNDRPGLEVD